MVDPATHASAASRRTDSPEDPFAFVTSSPTCIGVSILAHIIGGPTLINEFRQRRR